jgi:hypothetical protein
MLINDNQINFIFQCMYLPCLKVIWSGRSRICLRFMFYIGIMDVMSLNISTLFSAFIWCIQPNEYLIYVIGLIYMTLWIIECNISVLLAACRCLEVFTPMKAERIFGNLNGKIMMFFCFFYGVFGVYYSKPRQYSSSYVYW